jgi:hypothetical protein
VVIRPGQKAFGCQPGDGQNILKSRITGKSGKSGDDVLFQPWQELLALFTNRDEIYLLEGFQILQPLQILRSGPKQLRVQVPAKPAVRSKEYRQDLLRFPFLKIRVQLRLDTRQLLEDVPGR